jgi:exopolysaccharide biosynthesis polyprenyl glycosylphosphotransferase
MRVDSSKPRSHSNRVYGFFCGTGDACLVKTVEIDETGSRASGQPGPGDQEEGRRRISVGSHPGYAFLKRAMDLSLGIVLLVLLLPVLPLIAIMIRLDSPGPVLFRQTRIGLRGRPFTCFKFRSMVAEAEAIQDRVASMNETEGPIFKIQDDPRVTTVGRFLRRSSLDEILQVLNVLLGEMSLVGPRPPLPHEVERYEPWQRARLEVKPGITCLWQIAGRSHIGFDEWMKLDLAYIERRSFLLDLKILFRTLPVVIERKGAY